MWNHPSKLVRALDRLRDGHERLNALAGFTRVGLLSDAPDDRLMQRIGPVPPEAFPVLDAGVEGRHYALWLDDPGADREPPVVLVSPARATPERVRPIAASVEQFLQLVRRTGPWVDGDRALVAEARDRLVRVRTEQIRYSTLDGLGVVAPAEPPLPRPEPAVLERLAVEGLALEREVLRWADAGAPGLAIAVCRDVLAAHDAPAVAGFGALFADLYLRLGRPVLGDVASRSYSRDPQVAQALAEAFTGRDEPDA